MQTKKLVSLNWAIETARAALTRTDRDLNAVNRIETRRGTVVYGGWGQSAYIVLERDGKIVTGYTARQS